MHRIRLIVGEERSLPEDAAIGAVQAEGTQCDMVRHLHVIGTNAGALGVPLHGGGEPDPIALQDRRRAAATG